MSERTEAWLLELGAGARAALGTGELVHLLHEAPALIEVPCTRGRCTRVMLWEGEPIAYAALAPGSAAHERASGIVAVVVFDRDGDERPEYGALQLAGIPRRRTIDVGEAIPREALDGPLAEVAHAALRDAGAIVPVLDLHAVFGRPAGVDGRPTRADGLRRAHHPARDPAVELVGGLVHHG